MGRKKIVLVIVEGPSDDVALGSLLEQIYDESKVHVHIAHCDLTTEKGASYSTILKQLGQVVTSIRSIYHFKQSDFQEIVQIVDMDGAYIPNEAVIEDIKADKPLYSLCDIRTKKPARIIQRNEIKKSCLDKISTTAKLSGIPYQVYYMSSNLDHVLYNKQNSTDDEKEKDAYSFAENYKRDLDGFIRFIMNSSFSVTGSYIESWEYIKKGKHSLERHTNFGICIQRALIAKQNNCEK